MPLIEKIEIYHVARPMLKSYKTSFGTERIAEAVFAKIYSEAGYGWGESSPFGQPYFSSESAAGAFLVLKKFLCPLLLGKDVISGRQLQQHLRAVKGNYFAKAALDIAWWDMYARRLDRPLWQVIGGKQRPIKTGVAFGIMETVDALLDSISGALDAGFERVKLKFSPAWAVDVIKKVRHKFPDAIFHIDCNSAFTLGDAHIFKELDQYNLAMIEQPLQHDDLLDHAELQKQICTPICLDESIVSPDKARKAVHLGVFKWVNIKPGRVGGLTEALEINRICQQGGIQCWVGGMLESSLGRHLCACLASLDNMQGYPSDITASSRYYNPDISKPPFELVGPSTAALSEQPGIGAEPDQQLLEKFSVQKETITCETIN